MMLRALGLPAVALAIVCNKFGLQDLDQTNMVSVIESTPPTQTNRTIYFNPCRPVTGHDECASDDHFCVVERVKIDKKWVVTKVAGVGSKLANATESQNFQSDDPDRWRGPWHGGDGDDDDESGSDWMMISYEGAGWGNRREAGSLQFVCGPELSFEFAPRFYWSSADDEYSVKVRTPSMCNENSAPNQPGGGDRSPPKKGWGFLTWLFVLAIIGLIGYAGLTVYVNYANAHGAMPVDVGDILRDLPYLVRDLIRRLSDSLSARRSGYSAV